VAASLDYAIKCSLGIDAAGLLVPPWLYAHRAAASLDYEIIGQQALDTNINIFVESVNGLGSQMTSLDGMGAGAGGPITDVTLESVIQPAKEEAQAPSPAPLKVGCRGGAAARSPVGVCVCVCLCACLRGCVYVHACACFI